MVMEDRQDEEYEEMIGIRVMEENDKQLEVWVEENPRSRDEEVNRGK